VKERVVLLWLGILVGDVLGQRKGHHEVDLVQGITEPRRPGDVLQHRDPSLTRLRIPGMDQVRAGAEVDLVGTQGHDGLAQPVVHHNVLLRRLQRLLHHMRRDEHAGLIAQLGPGIDQFPTRLGVVNVQARLLKNRRRSPVQPFDSAPVHQGQARSPNRRSVHLASKNSYHST
jgi:hypothetical protein